MLCSNCCFLTCIQVSWETDKVFRYSYLLKNFLQFVVIHTVKGFGIVSKQKQMFFWNSFSLSMIQWMLAIWSLVPLPFLKPAWTSGSSWFTYCWSLAWRILSVSLLPCEMSAIVQYFKILWHCFSLGLEWKVTFSRPVANCWVFQICWHIECSTFTASSFRIGNSSTGIPSSPLCLLWCSLRPTWLCTSKRLALGEWSCHHGYLVH